MKMYILHLLPMVFIFFHLDHSDGNFGLMYTCCTYKDREKIFEYEVRYIFNNRLLMEFNSTRGNWTGFTEYTVSLAKVFNNDFQNKFERLVEAKALCDANKQATDISKNLTSTPSLKLTSVKQSSGTEPALLLCSSYKFYPKPIQMTWLLNGQEMTSAVSSTEVLSDDHGYYQIHSYLEYSPKPGEDISCMVEHVSLSQPLVQVWDPSLPWSEKVQIAVGTLFLVLGLLIMITGFIYYKKKNCRSCTLFQGHRVTPVQCVHEERTTSETIQGH